MISCIVTTRNEAKVLGNLLKSINNQTNRNFEIVVVDNNSSDDTVNIARKFTNEVFSKGPERSVQRNFGVKKAQGEGVLILDADMVLGKNVLKELAEKIRNKENLGAIIIPEKSFGVGFWTKFKVFEREFYVGDETIEAPRFFKKNLFLKFGGYDTNITGPEDYDLPLRMRKSGFKIGRIKSFIYHNERNFSPFKSARKKFYYASNAGTYLKRHPEMILSQGNMLFRPVFLKKWRKLVKSPALSFGMLFIKSVETGGALAGAVYSGIIRKK